MESNLPITKIVFFLLVGCILISCQPEENSYTKIEPVQLTHLEGTDLTQLTLTKEAASRLGIKTDKVTERIATANSTLRKVIPYASILYDVHGKTWVYKNPNPLVYVRHEIKIDAIENDLVLLHDGPPSGTLIVSQGAAELYGTEYEIGH